MKIQDYLNVIPNLVKQRGRNYFNDNKVKNIIFDEYYETYTATVVGTKTYITTAQFEDDEVFKLTCTCPVNGVCKHEVALLYHLLNNDKKPNKNDEQIINIKTIFRETVAFHQKEVKQKDVLNFSKHFLFKKDKKNNTFDFHQEVYYIFMNLKEVLKEEYFKLYIETYLNHFINKSNFIHVIKRVLSVINDEKIKSIYYEAAIINKKNFIYDSVKTENFFIDILLKLISRNNLIGYLFNFEGEVTIELIRNKVNENKDEYFPLNFVFDFLDNPTVLNFEKLLEYYNKKDLNAIFSASKVVPTTFKEALFYKRTINKNIKYDQFKLSYDEIKNSKDSIINNDLNGFISFINKDLNTHSKLKIYSNEEAFKILALFEYDFDFDNNELHYYYGLKHGLIKKDDAIVIDNKGLPREIKQRYNHIFKFDSLREKAKLTGILFLDEKSFNEMLVIYDFNRPYPLILTYHLTKGGISANSNFAHEMAPYYLLDFFNTISSEEIESEYTRKTKALEIKRREAMALEHQQQSDALVLELSNLLQDEVSVSASEKVEIEIILSLEDKSFENNIHKIDSPTTIGIKTGVNHKYFVKSLETFLNAVEERKTVKYGSKLAFNHQIDSFTKDAQNLIEILDTSRGFGSYKKNIGGKISSKNMFKLFNSLIGKHLYVFGARNYFEYDLILFKEEPFEVDVKMSKEGYEINLEEYIKKRIYLIIYPEFDVLINLNNNFMQFVKYKSLKQRKLVHFLIENKELDYEFALPKLVETVIPHVYKDISLTEDIKVEVEKSKLVVDSYFDYNETKDQIELNSKVYRNDIELDIKDILDNDLEYKKYLNILNTFGFENNIMNDQTNILMFLNADLTPFKDFGDVYITENIKSKQVVKRIDTKIQVSLVDNMLLTHIEAADLDDKELRKVLEAYRLGKKYVLLKDKVILTNTEEIKNLNTYMLQNEINLNQIEKSEKSIYEIFKLDQEALDLNIDIDSKLKEIIDDVINFKNFKIDSKPSMFPLLKNYQVDGLKWLKVLAKHNLGGILADDMGLGKTLQIISFLESEDFDLSIVICPKSLTYNWAYELEKFNSKIKPIIYAGTKLEREDIFNNIKKIKDKTLIIVSYDTLRNDIDLFLDLDLHTIILDEAQHIKTSTAQKTRAVKKLKSKNKFILTGTPIENSIFDLWSIFDFVMPGYLYSASKFKKLGDKVHESDEETINFLIMKTKPFILRRTKKEVLKELPEKVEEIMYATFDGKHKETYDAYLLKVKEKLEDSDISKFDILSDLTRLRQLCISPKLVYDYYNDEHIKLDVIYELIREATNSGHKVLVFSSFVKALDLLKTYLNKDKYYMLTGDTKAELRAQMANDFNREESAKNVFLISLKAGGTGLNLTGADVVIHLDPWWNLAAENQASDRAHRIGQKRSVTVYKVVMKDSIEEKIIILQQRKKDLFDQMIEQRVDIEKLDFEDYKYILS